MMNVTVSPEIASVCPDFVGACLDAQVQNSPYSEALWEEIHQLENHFRDTLTTESLKEISSIAATRRVYKACGKDPSRYRPASEALIRRMLQGKELYQIDTLVDLINLASIRYGYSIGGFDASKFVGDTLTLGIGRDQQGGVGTPTSDNERTKIELKTTHLVVLINGYDGNRQRVSDNARFIQTLLQKYCNSDGGSFFMY